VAGEQSEVEVLVGELEQRLDRLRALYDQYFMGIEKLLPSVPHKDVERRLAHLRKQQIRNTALRFRFQVAIQKYNTYITYWTRICRQIEEGTYKRDLRRAKERFGKGAKDLEIDVEFDDSEDVAFDVESEMAALEAQGVAADLEHDTVPPITERGVLPHAGFDFSNIDSPMDDEPVSWGNIDAQAPVLALPRAQPVEVKRRMTPPAVIPGDHKRPSLRQIRVTPPEGAPAAGLPSEGRLQASRSQAQGPIQAKKRSSRPPPGQGAPKRRSNRPPPFEQAAAPPAVSTQVMRAATPIANASRLAPKPAPQPQPRPKDDLPDERLRQLYSQYIEAKRLRQESTTSVTYDSLAKSLRESSARLKQMHAGKKVDFEVAEKDGKTILRPIVK
jgi:hypothetical protein